jgi:hypothetical protein
MIPARAGLPIAVVLPLVAAQDAPPTGETIMDRYIAVTGGPRGARESQDRGVRVRTAGLCGDAPKGSPAHKRLNLLQNRADRRRRAGRKSSKRVHDGEPPSSLAENTRLSEPMHR